MQHAYRSFHNALEAAWTAIAPGVPMLIDSPDDADALPAECLRVFWSSYGDPVPLEPNRREAVIDLAVRVPPVGNQPNTNLALTRASAVDVGLRLNDAGLVGGGGYGRLGRFDWTTNPITFLTDMDVYPDHGWVAIPTNSPGQLHLARTLRLFYWL